MTNQWLETWDVNPIPVSDYLTMAEYIYQHYDMILRRLPVAVIANVDDALNLIDNPIDW